VKDRIDKQKRREANKNISMAQHDKKANMFFNRTLPIIEKKIVQIKCCIEKHAKML